MTQEQRKKLQAYKDEMMLEYAYEDDSIIDKAEHAVMEYFKEMFGRDITEEDYEDMWDVV
jgi:hypothetical protein